MVKTLGLAVLICSAVLAFSRDNAWNIRELKLLPGSEPEHRLTISAANVDASFQIDSDVPLSNISSYFVWNNHLAVLGAAGRADAVVVFDLFKRAKIDWFYCYQPTRISDDLVAYVEWYPSHSSALPSDVVLVYDMAQNPEQNRFQRGHSESVQQLDRVRVGTPVFPERNANGKSYSNTVENQSMVDLVLGPPGFLGMPHRRLVFVAAKEPGGDATTISNRLTVVDLSRGLRVVSSYQIAIPTDGLKGKHAGYVRVTAMRLESPFTVRLFVPAADYGVDSIVVDIAKR